MIAIDSAAFYTLGCKVNQYETEAMMELFKKRGYEIRDFEEPADFYIINTCTVTNQSDRKSRQMINRARRNNPDGIIAVVGCYSQVQPEEVARLKGVDLVVGTAGRRKIVDYCEEAAKTGRRVLEVEDSDDHKEFEDLVISNQAHMTRAYIKIQEGCRMFCSYCIIPYARGPLKSRPLADIVKEAEKLAANGYKEIILTGIHVASYGIDLGKKRLIDVIEGVAAVDGIERIRLSSMEPRHIDEEFLTRMKNTGKACDHFHLSLQSGSDKILKAMNRKYDTALFREKTELIRKFFPEAGITTDIITGFPGETEEDFKETEDFAKEIGFSKIHVFKYSKRRGTPAATMKNQVNGAVKKERSHRLIALGEEMTDEFMSKFIGREMEVLWEGRNRDGEIEGYTTNYLRVKGPFDEKKINTLETIRPVSVEDEVFVI